MEKLSEIEMRILSELEEFREENLPAMTNTVMDVSGEVSERDLMKAALEKLVQTSLIVVGADRKARDRAQESRKEDSLSLLADIDKHLVFKSDTGHWTGGARPWPYVFLTDIGYERAEAVLDERGYRWWRGGE